MLTALIFGGIAGGLVYWQQEELPTGLKDIDQCVRAAEVKVESGGGRRRSASYVLHIRTDRYRFRHTMGGFGADEELVARVRPGSCFTFTVDAGALERNDPTRYKQPAAVVVLGLPPLRIYGLQQRGNTVIDFWDALGEDLLALGVVVIVCLMLALLGLSAAIVGGRDELN